NGKAYGYIDVPGYYKPGETGHAAIASRAVEQILTSFMYRYSNGQISLSDFKQPVGMNLKESNRRVKKAQTIP
ncbi:MAG: hypothetical protein SPI70_03785, partial [Oscillospiraceae bacterium]|nr:hypothetical protein [Oscillospiraceae bacterium]